MIEFLYYDIPLSVNKLYFTKGGRRVLSGPGRKFKTAFVASRGGLSAEELMRFRVDPESEYGLELWFFLLPDRLYNFTYGQDKRVKSPFNDLDVSNLVKLAEDSIAELLGLRDRNNFDVSAHKRPAERRELMVARLYPINIDLEKNPWARLTRG